MKKVFLILLLWLTAAEAGAAHIKGGFLSYEYLGVGNVPNTVRYKLRLTVYMQCFPSAGQVNNPINLTIFSGSGQQIDNVSVSISERYELDKSADDPCITGDQRGCYYTIVVYELASYQLPVRSDGYVVSYQRCCRIASMDNLQSSASTGNTYTIKIPGTSSPALNAIQNSSPVFAVNDTVVVCGGSAFSYSLAAFDLDGDSLSYELCEAFAGGSVNAPSPNEADPPGYPPVSYSSPYSGNSPMGSGVTLNARTGVLSGIAPQIAFSGEYVVTVCVFEYRNGVQFAESRKELHIRVRDCIPIEARLDPRPVTCDGFTVQFVNDADPLPAGTTYEWQFGDTASGAANTSTQQTPSHTYADTGRYLVKLKVTTGGFCADSTTLLMRVYPGFFPAFNANPPFCIGVPVTFTDFTTTRYGVPTGWHWDFGETTTLADTARTKNASYIYNTPGNYTVTLVVGNTFGCVDTITRNVTIIEKPPLTLSPKDTTYCALDSVSLRASSSFGAGVYSWLPATNIIGANTAEPLVFPTVPTKYYVNFNISGCTNTDSVMVRPVNNVTATIAASALNICQEDTLQLTASSNYSNVKWQWQPAASLSSDTARQVKAFPSANTTYNLRVNWGKCTATASRAITVTPLAVPEAGPNAAICFKQDTARLSASGGVSYTWTPATGLDNPNSPNPIATPTVTTTYKVAVSVAGCARTKTDSVTVLVRPLPNIQLTNDTLICSIDTLRLQTSNAGSVVWTPNYMINNLLDNRPLVSPDVPTTYFVTMTDGFGCINRDSVKVDVKLFVTIEAGNDTTICLTDSLRLPTISDALSYQWSPGLYMNNINIKNPVVRPAVPSITYRVLGNIGKCQSTDSITIRTVPYPVPDAGVFSTVCYGVNSLLNASGGSQYTWSPARFLSNRNVANPSVINPTSTTLYTVTITDTLGCPKPVTDTVTLNVLPRVIASTGLRDTGIVIGQTLQFNASGGNRYTWSPSTWLNSSFGARPVAAPEDNIVYKLLVTVEPFGCSASDSVKIKVFKLPPSFYVPTAFSPNGDGKNDVLRPIALGMRSLNYFRVYNRRGELVFSTNQLNKGWDGFYKGNPQDPQNFVWMAQGLTFDGQLITRKGNAVLVR